jgi:hypothetical protein
MCIPPTIRANILIDIFIDMAAWHVFYYTLENLKNFSFWENLNILLRCMMQDFKKNNEKI